MKEAQLTPSRYAWFFEVGSMVVWNPVATPRTAAFHGSVVESLLSYDPNASRTTTALSSSMTGTK